jgi:predicted component of type VI protein secretion system
MSDKTQTAAVAKTLDDLFPADRDMIDDAVAFELTGKTALHVRRIDNRQFQGFVETMQKKHKFQFDHNLVGEDEKVRFLIPGIARFLLTGWDHFPPEKPVPYSVPEAERLLGERKTLVKAVLGMANENRAFVREREEAAAKNSPSGSPGNSSGEGG